jgi:hypothetical protein
LQRDSAQNPTINVTITIDVNIVRKSVIGGGLMTVLENRTTLMKFVQVCHRNNIYKTT